MGVHVVVATTLTWGKIVMQSLGIEEATLCGNIDSACIYVLYCIDIPKRGLIIVHFIQLLVF